VKQETFVKPTNPITAKARAVISVHAKHRHFPDEDADKVRYLENERIIRKDAEQQLPSVTSVDFPLIVRTGTARDVLSNAYVTGNRDVTGRPNINVFSRSISCKSVAKDLSSDVGKLFQDWSGGCDGGGHQICSLDKSKRTFNGNRDSSIKIIPSCIKRLVKLKRLYLSDTGVSKIEGLEKNVKLNEFVLSETGVSKIEGLEKNVNLNVLSLSGTGVSKIEGLENNGKLKLLYLSNTGIKKIEGLEKNVNLKELFLNNTIVSKIEGLENNVKLNELVLGGTGVSKIEGLENNVNLEFLDLFNTGVSKSDCDEFKEARPSVSLSC
jgi:hypothetical protein